MRNIESIYVIDDDDTYQFIMKHVIEETHFVEKIKVFSNGKEALDLLIEISESKEEYPEIILLDLTMPVMDGWTFLENFIQLKPKPGNKTLIYIVSSSVNPVDVERAKHISAVTDYMVKPVTRDKLLEIFTKV